VHLGPAIRHGGLVATLADLGVPLADRDRLAARYVEIDTELGHLASGLDGEKWAPALRAFMEELARG